MVFGSVVCINFLEVPVTGLEDTCHLQGPVSVGIRGHDFSSISLNAATCASPEPAEVMSSRADIVLCGMFGFPL